MIQANVDKNDKTASNKSRNGKVLNDQPAKKKTDYKEPKPDGGVFLIYSIQRIGYFTKPSDQMYISDWLRCTFSAVYQYLFPVRHNKFTNKQPQGFSDLVAAFSLMTFADPAFSFLMAAYISG